MSAEETLEEVLSAVRDSWLSAVHTSIPGKVVRYDASAQVADVQPLVKDIARTSDDATVTRSYPLLASVPVQFTRGGGAFLATPINPGDTGMLVFCQLPIDRWRANGQESAPGDVRRHSLTSAVFFPGLAPRSKTIAEIAANTDAVFGFEGGSAVHVKPGGEVHLGDDPAPDFVALAQKVMTALNAIQLKFDAHTHVVATTGTATAQSGTAAPVTTSAIGPLADVSAAKVKAT